jgi:hypothetical protein
MVNNESFTIPPAFWKSLSTEEFRQICETSELSAEQCAKVWRMLDLQGEPPDGAGVMVNSADLMKVFPEIKRSRGPHKGRR